MDKIGKILSSFLGLITDPLSFLGAGTVNVALKIILLVGVVWATWSYLRWKRKMEIEKARREEEQRQTKDQQDMVPGNRQSNEDAKGDSKAADDFLKKP